MTGNPNVGRVRWNGPPALICQAVKRARPSKAWTGHPRKFGSMRMGWATRQQLKLPPIYVNTVSIDLYADPFAIVRVVDAD